MMSIWHYYIELKADPVTVENMISVYNDNMEYRDTFVFEAASDENEDGYSAGISSIIDNFLPANYLIYNFLSRFSSCGFSIKTNNIERIYDFVGRADFIKFMYDSWQPQIDFLYSQFGTIVINYKDYSKVRNKLYKKYYKKIC